MTMTNILREETKKFCDKFNVNISEEDFIIIINIRNKIIDYNKYHETLKILSENEKSLMLKTNEIFYKLKAYIVKKNEINDTDYTDYIYESNDTKYNFISYIVLAFNYLRVYIPDNIIKVYPIMQNYKINIYNDQNDIIDYDEKKELHKIIFDIINKYINFVEYLYSSSE